MTTDESHENTVAAPVSSAGHVIPVDLRDYATFSTKAANRVRVFASAFVALDLWCLEPQQATAVLHYPTHDVTYTVIGGRSWFVTDDGEIGLDPLGALLVPAGTMHGIDNRAPDPLIVLASSAPPTNEPASDPVSDAREAIRVDTDAGVLHRALRSLRDKRGA
jgi:quercetin dioxygenase-like cupin family protein